MEGKLGAIYIGEKQVGGFLDWRVKLNIAEGVRDEATTRKFKGWKVTAWAQWLFKPLNVGDEVKLKLCADAGPVFWCGTGRIANRLTANLNMLVHAQLEVLGNGELEPGKVDNVK